MYTDLQTYTTHQRSICWSLATGDGTPEPRLAGHLHGAPCAREAKLRIQGLGVSV